MSMTGSKNRSPEQQLRSTGWLLLAALGCTVGCNSLERFDTRGDAAFCGELVRAPRFQGGLLPIGARPPTLSLRLELDADKLVPEPMAPPASDEDEPAETYTIVGLLTSDDSGRGLCAESERALFEEAPLRTIPELDHDMLKLLSFGEGRDSNFMAWVDSTCQGTMLAVVSLMHSGSVEVRLLKPAELAPPDAEPAKRPGFGLFYLHREAAGCDF